MMLALGKLLTLEVLLHAILAPIGGKMPTQEEIWTALQDPVCQVELGFWKQRYVQYGLQDPLFAHPSEKDGIFVFESPLQQSARILKVLSYCQRMDLLRSMLQGRLIPFKHWTQPALPPKDPSCALEPIEMRLSNVHTGGGLQINGVHAFGVHEGNVTIQNVAEEWMYRPGLPGGDTGWKDVRQWMKPGNNEVTPHLHNVRIPSGFLNLGTTPSPLSMKVEVKKKDVHRNLPNGFVWLDVKPYQFDRVGYTRLTTGSFHLNVICDGKMYIPQLDRPSAAIDLPYYWSDDETVRLTGWCKDTRAWFINAKKWQLAHITPKDEDEVERMCEDTPTLGPPSGPPPPQEDTK